jgi:peroxiredoxin
MKVLKEIFNVKKWMVLALAFFIFTNANAQEKDYTLYIFLLDNCKICQSYTLKMNELYDEYHEMVEFIGVFPNIVSTQEKIDAYKEKYKVEYPLITDYDKALAKGLNATITPEVFLIDNNTEEVLYSGRIDDEFFRVGKRKQVVTSFELKDALEGLSKNEEISVKNTEAIGCFINFFDIFEE